MEPFIGNRKSMSYSSFECLEEETYNFAGMEGPCDDFTYCPDNDYTDYSHYSDYSQYSIHHNNQAFPFNGNSVNLYTGQSIHSNISGTTSSDSLDPYQPSFDPRNGNYLPSTGSSFPNQPMKCRQLPCRTFISTGSCPYGDRCVFLHDPSVVSKPIYIRCKVIIKYLNDYYHII